MIFERELLVIKEAQKDKNNIKSSLTILLAHLFKYCYNPYSQSSGWIGTIIEQYIQLSKIAIFDDNKIVTSQTKFNIEFINIINDENTMNKIINKAINIIIQDNPGLKDSDVSFYSLYGYFNNYAELCDSVKLYNFLQDYANSDKIKRDVDSKYNKEKLKKVYTQEDLKIINYGK